jgi:hypothetical protein
VEAARIEAARVEAARVEAAQAEAARAEAARAEAARLESARQDAARLQAAQAAQAQAAQAAQAQAQAEADNARREAARRAMGRQLDEEAARRDAASKASNNLPYSYSSARRGRLFGRSDPNAELVLYAEAWARKLQFNAPLDGVRELVSRPHTRPQVQVAIRSDGSVESVTFVVPSGVPEIDNAIRRLIEGLVPFQPFPPNLAREFDVVEIRRTWHFDSALRLY